MPDDVVIAHHTGHTYHEQCYFKMIYEEVTQ